MEGNLFDIQLLADHSKRGNSISEIRKRVQSTYIGDGLVLCRVLGRFKFYVHGDDSLGINLIMDGFWEPHVTHFIADSVKPGMTVLDLGANYGYFTVLMAALVGPKGRVHAVEANPAIVPNLQRNIQVNGFGDTLAGPRIATVHEKGVWHTSNDVLTFGIPPAEAKNARILAADQVSRVQQRGWKITEVKTMALDDFDVENVSFIKADVEGAEEALWHGMRQFVKRNANLTMLLEFNVARCADARGTLTELSETFRIRHLERNGQILDTDVESVLRRPKGDWLLVLGKG